MAKKKLILPKQAANPVNQQMAELEDVQERVAELQAQKGKTVESIRNAFKEAVVVFIDMVGSTQFKVEHATEPDEDDLFNYQLDDPEFWHKKIGYYVL